MRLVSCNYGPNGTNRRVHHYSHFLSPITNFTSVQNHLYLDRVFNFQEKNKKSPLPCHGEGAFVSKLPFHDKEIIGLYTAFGSDSKDKVFTVDIAYHECKVFHQRINRVTDVG